jgi:hypothetical protein
MCWRLKISPRHGYPIRTTIGLLFVYTLEKSTGYSIHDL